MNVTSNSSGTYSGGHISHTGQLFFNDTLTDSVALISPYSNHTIVRTRNSDDGIYASSNGSVTIVSIAQNSVNNYTGMVTLGVNSSATPSAVGGGEMGPGIGQLGPNGSNMTMPPGGPPGGGSPPSSSSSSTTAISTTLTGTISSNESKLVYYKSLCLIMILLLILF
jgi:hypothetical protein